MGRATRWFKSLLSTKKDNKDAKNINVSEEFIHKDKKRWSFKSGRDSNDVASNAAWLKSINIQSESENDQNRHAIAVAAATAAAADAAVLAAQAAVEVVRLTSQGRRGGANFVRANERATAAVKIQKFFRAYLAKKALRALKALVKLQALVRGFLVRKQAAKTLLSMQALIRAQASVRAHKSRVSASNDRKVLPEFCSQRSLEMFDEKRSEQIGTFLSHRLSGNLDNHLNEKSPKIVEIDTCRPKSRSSQSRTSTSVIDSLEDMSLNPISVPEYRYFQDYDWCRHSYTAQSTPRYMNVFNGPPTPTKSVNLQNSPSYMNNTQSFEAKVRSQSTPRQRPELIVTPRKRTPLTEVLFESRGSLSGIGMQRSCVRAQVNSGLNVKKASVERLDRSLELSREFAEGDYYRKW